MRGKLLTRLALLLLQSSYVLSRIAFEKLTDVDFPGTAYYTVRNLSLYECEGWCREEPDCQAASFRYSIVLKPDTSYHTGFIMSSCSVILWQLNGPRRNLRHYEGVASLLFTMAVFILALGPFSLTIVNYGLTFIFTIITIQQLYDADDSDEAFETPSKAIEKNIIQENVSSKSELKSGENSKCDSELNTDNITKKESENIEKDSQCDVCNESRIYNIFKNLRDKFSFSNDELEH